MMNDPNAPVSLAAQGQGPTRQGGIVMPEGQQVPSGLVVGLAIQFVINGDVTSINCCPQTAAGDGTNVTVGGLGAAAVAVAGAHGSATGGQAVQAGRDAAAARAEDLPSRESWWARLRKRGLFVVLATIIGAIATVVGTAAAICALVGWTP
jgi:hypothetical protein